VPLAIGFDVFRGIKYFGLMNPLDDDSPFNQEINREAESWRVGDEDNE
jgi:hypothetical protein